MAEKFRLRRDLEFTAEQYRSDSILPSGAEMFEDDGERYPVLKDKDGCLVPLEHGDWVLEGADGKFVVSADNFLRLYESVEKNPGGRYYPNLTRVGSK